MRSIITEKEPRYVKKRGPLDATTGVDVNCNAAITELAELRKTAEYE
jgi:hypothetical protein